MRKLNGFVLSLVMIFATVYADAAGNEKKAPLNVLLFHGGRPWTGSETARLLKNAGFQVTLVDSTGLNGLGGAPIRYHLTDKYEPPSMDLITPEFEHLDEYDVVIVAAIKPDDQKRFFSEVRLNKLKAYLSTGGGLITFENVPSGISGILPVNFKDGQRIKGKDWFCRSNSDIFTGLPEQWPCFLRRGRRITPKEGATILASAQNPSTGETVPYLVTHRVGEGTSIYWNAECSRINRFVQLRDWAYFRHVLTTLVRYGAGREIPKFDKMVERYPQPVSPAIATVRIALKAPIFNELNHEDGSKVVAYGDKLLITFANDVLIEFDKTKLTYNAFYPGVELPVFNRVPIPVLVADRKIGGEKLDMSTYEAVMTGRPDGRSLPLKLHYVKCEVKEKSEVTIQMNGQRDETFWLTFKAGDLTVNNRSYQGYGVKSAFTGFPESVESIKFISPAFLGDDVDSHEAWRMACYAPPRGFQIVDFANGIKASTNVWQHFGTGQPFNWIVGQAGILCEFLDSPFVNFAEVSSAPKGGGVVLVDELLLGKVQGTVETPFLWRYLSLNRPSTPNSWLGMYQFLRKRYRKLVGLKESSLYPESTHTNTCTEQEVVKSIDAAKKLDFRIHKLPLAPSAIETLNNPDVVEVYRLITERGLEPKPWSAGGYTQGLDNSVAAKHPEWLVYNKKDEPLQYFGSHPVFDINNPAYRSYYISLLNDAMDNGMRHIYLDMAGAQASVVNYRKKNDRPQLFSSFEIYRAFDRKGVTAGVEGMNPLVVDEFWFRKGQYVNHTGKEFAFVGMSPSAIIPDHLVMDYFRMAMYNAFIDVVVSGYACGMNTVVGERKLLDEIGKINPALNKAIDLMGVPFVQQTSFGTSWTSSDGAALFFWNPVDTLLFNLPNDWRIDKVMTLDGRVIEDEGGVLRGIPHKSIVVIRNMDAKERPRR